MARNGLSSSQIPAQQDESVMTTLRVIMDVLKSHDGSIKKLQKWLDHTNDPERSFNHLPDVSSFGKSTVPPMPTSFDGFDHPVLDVNNREKIPDDRSEVSSIISSRTEYQELPTRSTINESTQHNDGITDQGLSGKLDIQSGGFFSTPMKSSTLVKDFPDKPSMTDRAKFDTTLSSIEGNSTVLERPLPTVQPDWQAERPKHASPPMRSSFGGTAMDDRVSPGNNKISVIQTKLNLLENQVSEWGEIMDEMSDRMAKQPSLIRKFAKESTSDKVGQSQYVEDLEILEKRLNGKMDEKLSSFDRKMVEFYDDMTSRINAKPAPRDTRETQYARQDTAVQMSIEMESLSEQFEDQKSKMRMMQKDINDLGDLVGELKHDVNMCRHHIADKRSDEDLVSLVTEQLLEKEEVTGWRTALKEMHSALNKQSEINTSLHHSYASLDKKVNTLNSMFPLHGRWRWGGISSVYPKGHSCTNGHHAEDISFVSQLANSDRRIFLWEKNKPYIVVTSAGCYWVKIGGFAIKSSSPPSLQITVDEEPVPLFNSAGKSPSAYKISVTSSAPKHQSSSSSSRHKTDASPWRPGSTLSGAVMLAGHSRLGIWAASTISGTRLAVEGYIEIYRIY